MVSSLDDAGYTAATQSIHRLLQDALHAVRTHLGLEVAFISQIQSGRRIFRHIDSVPDFSPIHVGDSDPVDQSFCQRVVDGRLPGLLTDAREHPEAQTLDATMQMPIGAHLSVPIRVGEEVFGTFCCFSREPNASLDDRDLALVRVYADFVGRLLEKNVHDQRIVLKLHERIRRVLDEASYYIVYQPIIHVETKKLVGHEALTRFTAEPQQSPDRWFSAAAEVGLQVELELAVMRRALADFGHFPEGTYLSLNVSPQTLLHGGVLEVLGGYPLDRVMLEVTEHASIEDYSVIAEKLAPLRQHGLRLAVDDAGAGWHYLTKTPKESFDNVHPRSA